MWSLCLSFTNGPVRLTFAGRCRFDLITAEYNNYDEPGMLESCRAVDEIVAAEIDAGIASQRIVVGGFSQGGVISLLYGLTTERKLAGIIMTSGYLVLPDKLKSVRGRYRPHPLLMLLTANITR